MGVPYVPIERIYQAELDKDFESIKAYQRASYYDGNWKQSDTPWARMLADAYQGEGGERFAWNMALTSDMVLSQPVVYEFDRLAVPTVLMIGLRDRTAIGRGLVDDDLAACMGDYPALTDKVAGMIPDVEVVRFEGVGHLPHIEVPERYLQALERVLRAE